MTVSRSLLQTHDMDQKPNQLDGHQPKACYLRSEHLPCTGLGDSPHSPVEEVIAANHTKEAGGVSHRVELVVHLFKLLVHEVSGFTLCLAAGTGPVGKGRESQSERGSTEHESLLCGPVPFPRPTNPWYGVPP